MKTTTQRRRRLVHRLAVALAAALLAAPAAQAVPLESPPGSGFVPERPQVVAEPDGWDWTDAGIGAGAATVATLLAVGAGTLAHRRLASSHPRVQGTAS